MKNFNSYVIVDDSCLKISFNSSVVDDVKLMRYARQKANCPYFRVMKARKPYTVFKKQLVDFSVEGDEKQFTYKLVKVGVID